MLAGEVILSEQSPVPLCDFTTTMLNHFVILPLLPKDLLFSLSAKHCGRDSKICLMISAFWYSRLRLIPSFECGLA